MYYTILYIILGRWGRSSFTATGAWHCMFMLSRDSLEDEDEDRDPCTSDPNDDADLDLGGGAPPRADPLDPLANFLKELKDTRPDSATPATAAASTS